MVRTHHIMQIEELNGRIASAMCAMDFSGDEAEKKMIEQNIEELEEKRSKVMEDAGL